MSTIWRWARRNSGSRSASFAIRVAAAMRSGRGPLARQLRARGDAYPHAPAAGLGDWSTYRKIARIAAKLDAQVLHGHGAKGGAYARLAGRRLKREHRT